MGFNIGFNFKTRIGIGKNKADYRVDTVPCNMNFPDGTICVEKQRLFLKYKNFEKQIEKRSLWLCSHKQEELRIKYDGDLIFQDVDLIVDAVDIINKYSSVEGSKSVRWKKAHDEICLRHPNVAFKEYIKPETRPGKGKVKEYRCSLKTFYEKRLQEWGCGEVWDGKILRKDANKTIFPLNTKTIKQQPQVSLKDYDSTPCECGHDIGAHDSYGKCPVCKKLCDVGDFA